MQQLYDMGVRILFFCGGETFLWQDGELTIKDLVAEAKRMGFLIVNVVTNGTFPIDLPECIYFGVHYSNIVRLLGRLPDDKGVMLAKIRRTMTEYA